MPRSARMRAKASTRASDGRLNGMLVAASSGSDSTLALMPSRRRHQRRHRRRVVDAVEHDIFEGDTCRRLASGKRRQASMIAARLDLPVGGTIAEALFWPWRQRDPPGSASAFGGELSSSGPAPLVDRVTSWRVQGQAVRVVQQRQRLHRGVVVVQGLADAHEHDVERLSRATRSRWRSTRTWRRSRPRQVTHQPHLAGQAG